MSQRAPLRPPPGRQEDNTRHKPTGFWARVWLWTKGHPLLIAFILAATVASAAVTISYTTPSTLTAQTVSPPVQYLAGTDAGPAALSDYVTAYSISTNKTFFTSTIKGVPEATLTVDSFFRLDNVDDASRSVTLTTAQVANANVDAYTLAVYDSTDTLQGTMDLTAASPSASFTIPANGGSEPFYATLTLTLASGTTDADLGGGIASTISLSVS